MSKMDRIINSKVDQQSIYEIYRSCRLCGAGAGYKMPIIQNILNVDGDEVQLKQKIQDCIRIEVQQDDKMPPLICEVCVDKVNDYYEFMEQCHKTNKQTRQRLGLPLETLSKGKAESGDCILGVTEPVYLNDKEEPQSRSSSRKVQIKVPEKGKPKAKKPEVKVKEERPSRSHRRRSPSPPPARTTRHSTEDSVPLHRLKTRNSSAISKTPAAPLKSILKKPTKVQETSPTLRSKRTKEPPKPEVPAKRVKLTPKAPPKPPPPPPGQRCPVCRERFKTPQALSSHLKSHTVTYTNVNQSCAACSEWFPTADAAATHHRRHRSFRCRYCRRSMPTHSKLMLHIKSEECNPWTVVPDVKCEECWLTFPTQPLLNDHRCQGADRRPGGKCSNCSRTYALRKNLMKHELTCTSKRKEFVIAPALRKKLRPFQVRVAKCDSLLSRRGRCDVSGVPKDHGLDSACVYPYFISAALNRDRMVKIMSPLYDLYCEADYIHWDSEISDDELTERKEQVYSLATLSLKTLFSLKCLGRVPKKRRKIKVEPEIFDSLANNEDESNLSTDISKIIDNLGEDHDDVTDASSRDVSKNDDNGTETNENVQTNDNVDCNAENACNEMDETTLSENERKEDENGTVCNDEKSTNQNSMEVDKVENAESNNTGDGLTDNKDSDKISDRSREKINTSLHTEVKTNKDNEENNLEVQANDEESALNSLHNYDKKDKCDAEQSKDNSLENISTANEKNSSPIREFISNDKECEKSDVDNLSAKQSESIENKDSSVNCDSINEEKYQNMESIDKETTVNNEINNVHENMDDLRCEDENDSTNSVVKHESDVLEKEVNITENDTDISNDVENLNNTDNTVNDCTNEEQEIDNDKNTDYNFENMKKNDLAVNGDIDETSDKLNMDEFKDESDSYIDDKKLMDALDEHIGENSDKSDVDGKDDANNDENECNSSVKSVGVDGKVSDCVKTNNSASDSQRKADNDADKISLEDLMPKKVHPCMELDNISDDELNFD